MQGKLRGGQQGGPEAAGLRYCMNAVVMRFVAALA